MWQYILLVFVVTLLLRLNFPKNWTAVRKFSSPPHWPVVGVLPVIMRMSSIYDMTVRQRQWHRTYASPLQFHILGMLKVHVYKADQVEALVKPRTNLTKGKPHYDYVRPWLGNGLLTSTNDEWFHQRKILTPSFHFGILKRFVPIFNEHSRKFCEYLSETNGQAIDVRQPLTLSTLDMICETSMGKKLHALRDSTSGQYQDYIQAIKTFGLRLVYRTTKVWLQNSFLYNMTRDGSEARKELEILHTFTNRVINEKERSGSFVARASSAETDDGVESNKQRLCLLDLLLDLKRRGVMTREEVREQVDTFMFEGHDTTATALMWLFYCLGRHQNHQQAVFEEIQSLLPDDDEDPTAEQLSQLATLDRFIKESQRLYPSVPIIARHLEQPVDLGSDHVLPADQTVEIHIHTMHRDAEQFPEPDKFDPERFVPSEIAKRHPFAFSPFSAGPRNCIGQKFALLEIKALTVHVLRRFRLMCKQCDEDVRPAAVMVLRPEAPIMVAFELRDSSA